MTTITNKPTNTAREQFLAIMRERQGKPQPKPTTTEATETARETVKVWRESIKKLNDSRREIAKPIHPKESRHITPRPCKAATQPAAEYLHSLKDAGDGRPVSRNIEMKFGISDFTSKRLIREIFGKCEFRGWSKGRPHAETIGRYAYIRAQLDKMTERPTQFEVSKRFNIGTRAAAILIKEKFGEFYHDPALARFAQRCKHDERVASAAAFVATLDSRPTVVSVAKEFHLNKYAARDVIEAKFGKVAR